MSRPAAPRPDAGSLTRIAVEAEPLLRRLPGVLGVGVGIKEMGGRPTGELALRVYLREKKPLASLDPAEVVPPVCLGVRTDVHEQSAARPDSYSDRLRPLQGGLKISVVHNNEFSGTLGCLATLDDGVTTVLLTNHHVLWAGSVLDAEVVYQPEYYTCCGSVCNAIGQALPDRRTKQVVSFNGQSYYVDCAVAQVKDTNYANSVRTKKLDAKLAVNGIAGVAQAKVGDQVRKVGAVTDLTVGVVDRVDYPAAVTLPFVTLAEQPNQILVLPTSTYTDPVSHAKIPVPGFQNRFSDAGDSGSVLVNDQNQVVGLHWAGVAHPSGALAGVACHILPVLDALKITINTTGTPIRPNSARVGVGEAAGGPDAPGFQTPLDRLEQDLRASEFGARLVETAHQNADECMDLVRRRRPVTVCWHRNKGPGFLNRLAQAARESGSPLVREIEGVRLDELARRMAAVLTEHGSESLRAALREFGPVLIAAAERAEHFDELMDLIRNGAPVPEVVGS